MALRLAVAPLRAPVSWLQGVRVSPVVPLQVIRPFSSSTKFTSFQFHKGALKLTLPIPKDDLDDWVTFTCLPGESVEVFMNRMREEDPCFKDITIKFADGTSADPEALMVSVIEFDVKVEYGNGDVAYKVHPPQYTGGAYGLMEDEGDLSLRTIMQKGAFAAVRRELEGTLAHSIAYDEYIQVCSKYGVPETEAKQLLHDLHRVGIVLHFHESKEHSIRDRVFLHPEEVVDAVFAEFGLEGPKESYIAEQRAKKAAEVSELEDMLKLKQMQVKAIEARARSWATLGNWVGFAGISGGGIYYAYLAFVELSWDIMEPVTYFTATGLSVVGYFWWLATSSEFEYESMYQTLFNWRQERLSKATLSSRDLEIDDIERKLNMSGGGSASDALTAELQHLRNDLEAAKEAMEILDVADYHPALLSVYLDKEPSAAQE